MNDGELLRRYEQEGDEGAFATLVERYLGLVHGTALRRVGDPHTAADVSQSVFCLLWRKAAGLHESPDLSGWLHRAACFKSSEALRAGSRRRFHEWEAAMMHEEIHWEPDAWAALAPELDDALERMEEEERTLILLRFYRRKSFRELGGQLGLSEDAARMRVNRALELLRRQLAGVGAGLGTTVLGELLDREVGAAAPAALSGKVLLCVQALRSAQPEVAMAGQLMSRAREVLMRPATLTVCGLVLVGLLWMARPSGPGDRAAQSDAEGSTVTGRHPVGALRPDGGGLRAMVNASTEGDELAVGLGELRRILRSAVRDNVWPPEDLRRCVQRLAGHPEAVLGVLSGELQDPLAGAATRERAIWGMWLLGDAVADAVPGIVHELGGVLREPGFQEQWGHAADALLHLGASEAAMAEVAAAVQSNPAAVRATLRFWVSAARRHPDEAVRLLSPWLELQDVRRLVAACALLRVEGVDRGRLIPVVAAGLEADPSHALDALEFAGQDAAGLEPVLRQQLAEAGQRGQTWLCQRLAEVLAAVAPGSRVDLPEVDHVLRVQEEAADLERKMNDGTVTVAELAAGAGNPKAGWQAAMELESMGVAAADALPALHEAFATADESLKDRLASAIKAIDPASPKPRFERDELLGTLRALSDAGAELGPILDEAQRQRLREIVDEGSRFTPEELARHADDLGELHPRLREVFVRGLVAVDPALETLLRKAATTGTRP